MSRRARPWHGSAGMGWRAVQPPHIAAGLLLLLLVNLPGQNYTTTSYLPFAWAKLGKTSHVLIVSRFTSPYSNLPPRPSRCGAHHGDPRRERRVQLPSGLSGRHPGAVRLAVGEEGRRNGTTAHTPLLQYNAAHLPCVCFCSVEDGPSARRAPQNVKYISCCVGNDTSYCPVLVVTRGRRGPGAPPLPSPRARPPHAFCVSLPLLRIASCTYSTALVTRPVRLTPQW